MGTFLGLLLIAVVVAAGAGIALFPALLVFGAVAFAIWLVFSIMGVLLHLIGSVLGLVFSLMLGALALVFGLALLPLVFPLLVLAGFVYLVRRNNQPTASQRLSSSV